MLTKAIVSAAIALALAATGAHADEDAARKEVKTKKIVIECDGEKCDDENHKVFIHGGGPLEWLGEDCEGDDCDIEVLVKKIQDGSFVKEICEDGDCDKHKIFAFHSDHSAPIAWTTDEGHGFHFGMGPRTYLGVQFVPLTSELADHFGAASDSAVMVSKVVDGSPADRAGVLVGDLITSIDGESLEDTGLARAIRGRDDGDTISLGVLRNNREVLLDATLETRESDFKALTIPHGAKHIEIHKMKGGEGPHKMRFLNTDELCDGLEECEVQIRCEGDDKADCSCEVNGESVDCPELE